MSPSLHSITSCSLYDAPGNDSIISFTIINQAINAYFYNGIYDEAQAIENCLKLNVRLRGSTGQGTRMSLSPCVVFQCVVDSVINIPDIDTDVVTK
jgi:hypothetical protein